MPLKGLFNPANAAPDTGGGGGFKEGLVRVDHSSFRVQPGREEVKDADPKKRREAIQPVLALVWDVTRLDESMEPMTDEHDAPLTEKLAFGLGGKTLANAAHPGLAETPEDEEIEDAGVAPNTEGPTLFLLKDDWQLHPKSGAHMLYKSLDGKYDAKYIDRVWAPDHVGVVCFMKSQVTDDKIKGADGIERPVTYKVVDKVIRGPYAGKGKAGAATTGKAAKDSKASDAEQKITPILQALSQELDGTQLTLKRLGMRVGEALKKAEVDPKLHVPILALVKDQAWMKKNAGEFDMTVNFEDNSVIFGTLKD